ncbi:MAG: hypothetical protein K2X01_05385 [Cyanobacteria bacterium]|nr:hypothetical protein [Cyanobacteriota bacterium]
MKISRLTRIAMILGLLSNFAFPLSLQAAVITPDPSPLVKDVLLNASASAEETDLVTLLPLDTTPLNNREPLVLIHGIGGESQHCFNWCGFINRAEGTPGFDQHFKIYRVRYESRKSVPAISKALQLKLEHWIQAENIHRFNVLAYSEGGLVFRNAFESPIISLAAGRVITVGSPFHGSPLASPSWIRQQLLQDSRLSPVRMTNRLSYWVTKKLYPDFEADFHWDNFDQAMPTQLNSISQGLNTQALNRDHYALEVHRNLITYGSFFGTDEASRTALQEVLMLPVAVQQEKPRWQSFWSKNPINHTVFGLVQKNIAKLPLAKYLQKQSLPSMTLYNDGISPISSSLWLGRYTRKMGFIASPIERLWLALAQLKGDSHARLFGAVDHRDLMNGASRLDEAKVMDLLHPKEPAKTVFEWYIQDLMAEQKAAVISQHSPEDIPVKPTVSSL